MTVAKLISALALTASAFAVASTPADAQGRRNRGGGEEQQQPATPPVSRPFAQAYQAVNAAIQTSNWTEADTALAALRAAAASDYEKFVTAQTDFRIASGQSNAARQAAAVTAMIDSNGIPAADQQRIYMAGAQMAYNGQDYANAAARAKRAIELGATEEVLPTLMLDAYIRAGQIDQAVAAANDIIARSNAAGHPAPEAVYSQLARGLQEADRNQELLDVLLRRAAAYPNQLNLRSAALIYLQNSPEDRSRSIDAMRLISSANAMNDRRFYLEYATSLSEDALPNEVLTAIAAGRAASLIPAGDATFRELETTARDNLAEDRASLAGGERRAIAAPDARLATRIADAYLAYENYAKAEELYTAALGKTGADTALINTRLGIVRFHAGNTQGALDALAQVSSGPRAPLARLWEALVRSRATPAPAAPAPATTN